MAKSLPQLEKQIAALQRQADTLKRKQVRGVVTRIREAIDYYQLTPADLGFTGQRKAGTKAASADAKPARKSVGRIKYRDEKGNTWTGHGRRPQWYLDAIASGKTPDQLTA